MPTQRLMMDRKRSELDTVLKCWVSVNFYIVCPGLPSFYMFYPRPPSSHTLLLHYCEWSQKLWHMGYTRTIVATFSYNVHETNRHMAVVWKNVQVFDSRHRHSAEDTSDCHGSKAMGQHRHQSHPSVDMLKKTIPISDIALNNYEGTTAHSVIC